MSARASKAQQEEPEMPRQSVLLANDLQNLSLTESAADPGKGQVPAQDDVQQLLEEEKENIPPELPQKKFKESTSPERTPGQ